MAIERVGVRLEPIDGDRLIQATVALGDAADRQLGRFRPAAEAAAVGIDRLTAAIVRSQTSQAQSSILGQQRLEQIRAETAELAKLAAANRVSAAEYEKARAAAAGTSAARSAGVPIDSLQGQAIAAEVAQRERLKAEIAETTAARQREAAMAEQANRALIARAGQAAQELSARQALIGGIALERSELARLAAANQVSAQQYRQTQIAILAEREARRLGANASAQEVAQVKQEVTARELLRDSIVRTNALRTQEIATAARAVGGYSALRGGLSNLSFQIQDIAIQAQAGVNPLTILVQQGSQIAGGFGPGAAAVGAFASVLAVAVTGYLAFTNSSDDAKASTDAFNEAQKATQPTLAESVRSVDELTAAYRRQTEAQRTAERLKLETERDTFADSIEKARSDAAALLSPLERLRQTRAQGESILGPDAAAADPLTPLRERQFEAIERFRQGGTIEALTKDLDALRREFAGSSDTAEQFARDLGALGAAEADLEKKRAARVERLNVLEGGQSTDERVALGGGAGGSSGGGRALDDVARIRQDAQREADATATELSDKVRIAQRELAVQLGELGKTRSRLAAELLGTPADEGTRRAALQQDIDALDESARLYRQATDRRIAGYQEADRKQREAEGRRLAAPVLKLERADDRLIADLRSQIGKPAEDPREAAIFDAQRRLSATATAAEHAQVRELAGALYDEAAAAREAAKAKQEGLALTERYRTSSEELAASEAELAKLLNAGAIDAITYQRALTAARMEAAEAADEAARKELEASSRWQDGARRALIGYSESVGDAADTAEALVNEGFRGIEGGLAGTIALLAQGKTSWEDWRDAANQAIGSVVEDLSRIFIRRGITGPLADALLGNFGTISGGAGQTDLGGGGVGGDLLLNARGNAFERGAVTAFAKGGVVDRPVFFPMAKGMGLMGEAGPEAVVPLKRTSDGRLGVASTGGGGVVINVIDQRSGSAPPVSVSERPGPDGRRMIEVMVRDVIASGAADPAMRSRYGAEPSRSRIGR